MALPKLRRTAYGEESEHKLDMSPMIDMVFLLLIFFIVNATAITVKTDPEVRPPIAMAPLPPFSDVGRIVVNVRDDGTYTARDFRVLADEDAIHAYVREARGGLERQALAPTLHLRGDRDSLFRHGRVAVRAAARADVRQVIFATVHAGR